MDDLTKANIWKSLEHHAQSFLSQPKPPHKQQFTASTCNIKLDYSNQRITPETLELLFTLADECGLRKKIHALMRGDHLNKSENRPALHTALRASEKESIWVNHNDVMPEIMATRHRMQAIADQIRAKRWFGFSGKAITDIVNIGIGGSDFGPRFALKALGDFALPDLGYHFISDADPDHFKNTVAKLLPETTLFIVSSKSFTTQETLYNAKKAMDWLDQPLHHEKHFIAVTANAKRAHQFGITTVLPIWEWVGGRYSFCSAINLITAIAIGYEHFSQLLAGANCMDVHFRDSDFASNLPVLLALLGIWNNNFLNIHNLLILTYSQRLEHFVPYIQQLDMESNGKSVDNQGNLVQYATGPIVWGGLGNQVQHSYYQLLCQGTHKVTADFISLDAFEGEFINNVCVAKINALTAGVKPQENLYSFIPGNTPLNHLRIGTYSPFTIGALVAVYEHKVFAQSVIWDINAFDQPGVESAKPSHLQTMYRMDAVPA